VPGVMREKLEEASGLFISREFKIEEEEGEGGKAPIFGGLLLGLLFARLPPLAGTGAVADCERCREGS